LCSKASNASSLPEVVPSSSWEIKPGEIIICKNEDGSDCEIGSGGFGKVCFFFPDLSVPRLGFFSVCGPLAQHSTLCL
jgi:hypothetical protein